MIVQVVHGFHAMAFREDQGSSYRFAAATWNDLHTQTRLERYTKVVTMKLAIL